MQKSWQRSDPSPAFFFAVERPGLLDSTALSQSMKYASFASLVFVVCLSFLNKNRYQFQFNRTIVLKNIVKLVVTKNPTNAR